MVEEEEKKYIMFNNDLLYECFEEQKANRIGAKMLMIHCLCRFRYGIDWKWYTNINQIVRLCGYTLSEKNKKTFSKIVQVMNTKFFSTDFKKANIEFCITGDYYTYCFSDNGNFTIVEYDVYDTIVKTRTSLNKDKLLMIYTSIKSFADGRKRSKKYQISFPTIDTIRKLTGMSKSTIINGINELEKLNLLYTYRLQLQYKKSIKLMNYYYFGDDQVKFQEYVEAYIKKTYKNILSVINTNTGEIIYSNNSTKDVEDIEEIKIDSYDFEFE